MTTQMKVDILRNNDLYHKVNLTLEMFQSFSLLIFLLPPNNIARHPPCPTKYEVLVEVKPVKRKQVQHDLRIQLVIVLL